MFLAIDKPHGITSYDVIRKLKKYFPRKTKIWHAWTLDPFATWLMLIGVWSWTKRLHKMTWQDKTYITTIDFSKYSDTRDLQYWEKFEEHQVAKDKSYITIQDKQVPAPTLEKIKKKLNKLVPKSLLPLTPFSAKKIDGKKLYEYAREWNPIFMNIEMVIHDVKIISYNFPIVELEIAVGKGTYIRSIGYWLGQQFGLAGTLTSLRRIQSGDIHLNKINNRNEQDGLKVAIIEK